SAGSPPTNGPTCSATWPGPTTGATAWATSSGGRVGPTSGAKARSTRWTTPRPTVSEPTIRSASAGRSSYHRWGEPGPHEVGEPAEHEPADDHQEPARGDIVGLRRTGAELTPVAAVGSAAEQIQLVGVRLDGGARGAQQRLGCLQAGREHQSEHEDQERGEAAQQA